MKKITLLVTAVLILAISVVAGAGEYFSPVEKGQICGAVIKALSEVGVLYHDTCTGGSGILVGPLETGEFLFIYANARGDIFIYQPSAKYGTAAMGIVAAVYEAIDNRPASDPTKLGRDLIK